MEFQKIANFLDTTSDDKDLPRFVTKKWIEVYDQSEGNYNVNKEIRIKTSMLRSDLCDFSDAYIVVKGTITVTNPDNNPYDKKLAFKNNAPIVSCTSKINNTLIDNAEDLDVIMPMYNLLEYSKKYSKTTGSFWNYYRDEPNSGANNNINYSIKDSKSFDYKTSITGKLEGNNTEKESEIVVPLKNFSNFWRTLDMLLITCEINLILALSEICVLISKATRTAVPAQGENPAVAAINNPTNTTFQIKDAKLYVPVVTLSTESDKILLEQLRTGFKITIKWNKCRSEMTNQTQNNNLSYLIDSTFTKVNRLFVLSFDNEDDRTSFSKYYVPSVLIKNFNVLIDGKGLFDMPIKNGKKTYEQIIEMGGNKDYTTGNLLDYEYFLKRNRFKQTN